MATERRDSGPLVTGLRATLRLAYRAVARSPAAPLLRSPVLERAHRHLTATLVTAADVAYIVEVLRASGVDASLAGGWACDALLGKQTRPHADLDLVIPERGRQAACAALAREGFSLTEVFQAGLMGTAVELLDRRGRRKVALHPVDIAGGQSDGWPAAVRRRIQELELGASEIFSTGRVEGRQLPCLSAPALVALHTGYPAGVEDHHDVRLLCMRFSLPIPSGYEGPDDVA